MLSIKATNSGEHYKTIISSSVNQLIADEPINNGGTDTGFSPGELMASSLAACTCITLRMYADRKNWNLTNVETEVNLIVDNETKLSTFERKITLFGNLSDDEEQRLLAIAEKCFIHKLLTNPIEIKTSIA